MKSRAELLIEALIDELGYEIEEKTVYISTPPDHSHKLTGGPQSHDMSYKAGIKTLEVKLVKKGA